MEDITVYSEKHTKPINTLCGKKYPQLFNVKGRVTAPTFFKLLRKRRGDIQWIVLQ
jgi:hypothetical protein